MKKLISLALGGVMLSVSALAFTAPAKADSVGFGPFGFNVTDGDPWKWRRHHRWDRRAYYDDDWRWRRHHRDWDDDWRWRDRHDNDFGEAAAATVFGLAAGAIAGSIVAGSVDDDSYYRCKARYRSFDEESWTYLGYDGDRHYCRL
jgi:hypothetical protein